MNATLISQLKRGRQGLNRSLRPLDQLIRFRSDRPPTPLFILGVPRSGTTLIYQILTQNLQFGYFPAVMSALYGLPNLLFLLSRSWLGRPRTDYRSHYGRIAGLLAPSEDASFWLQWFPADGPNGHYLDPAQIDLTSFASLATDLASLNAILKRPMVFKCLYLDMVVGVLAQLLPKAHFLVVQRNPLYNCQSLLLGRQRTPDRWWSVKIPAYRELLQQPLWHQVVEQYYWVDAIIRRDLECYAVERTLWVNYEAVCCDPNGFLDQMQEWLDPIGVQSYAQRHLPKRFPISQSLRIEVQLAKQMLQYLERLHGG